MTKGTRKAIYFSTLALLVGGAAYYFFVYNKNKVKGKRADFIANGFVYSVGSKAQAYPKKAGDFGGLLIGNYKDDKDFWLARNSSGQEILLRKSEVKII